MEPLLPPFALPSLSLARLLDFSSGWTQLLTAPDASYLVDTDTIAVPELTTMVRRMVVQNDEGRNAANDGGAPTFELL